MFHFPNQWFLNHMVLIAFLLFAIVTLPCVCAVTSWKPCAGFLSAAGIHVPTETRLSEPPERQDWCPLEVSSWQKVRADSVQPAGVSQPATLKPWDCVQRASVDSWYQPNTLFIIALKQEEIKKPQQCVLAFGKQWIFNNKKCHVTCIEEKK